MINQKKTILKLIPLIFLALAILIIPSVSAVKLDLGLNMTASSNNATISIDTIPIYVDQATITNSSIELINSSWTNGNLIVNTTGLINWTSGVIYSSAFPYLTAETNTLKTIENNLTQNITSANYTFSVQNCNNIKSISYTSNGGTTQSYQLSDFTCKPSTNKLTLNIGLLEPGANNQLTVSSEFNNNISPWCSAIDSGLGGFGAFFALIVLAIVSVFVIVAIRDQALMGKMIVYSIMTLVFGGIMLIVGLIIVGGICGA